MRVLALPSLLTTKRASIAATAAVPCMSRNSREREGRAAGARRAEARAWGVGGVDQQTGQAGRQTETDGWMDRWIDRWIDR